MGLFLGWKPSGSLNHRLGRCGRPECSHLPQDQSSRSLENQLTKNHPHRACGTEGAQGWGCCAGAGALAVGLPRSSHSSQVPVETPLRLPSWHAGRSAHVCVPLHVPEPSLVLAAEGGCSEPASENPSTVLSLTQAVEAGVEVLLSRSTFQRARTACCRPVCGCETGRRAASCGLAHS